MWSLNTIGFGIGATNSLLCIFSNNEKLLHLIHASDDFSAFNVKTITRFLVASPTKKIGTFSKLSAEKEDSNHSIVTYFISKYEKLRIKYSEYWLEVLDFLISLCKFNENGVNVNQMMISETFLQGPGAAFFLQIELRKPDNKLQVLVKQSGKELKYELIELFESIKSTNSIELASIGVFLKKQLQLASNLCFGRNYVNIKLMKKTFKMHVLMEYIWNESLPEDVRAIFVSLLLNIHIDIKPRTIRLAPQYSKKLLRKFEEKKAQPFYELQNSLMKNLALTNPTNNNKIEEKPKNETFLTQKSIDVAKKARQKLYDVVVDINRIKNVTGNLKLLGRQKTNNPNNPNNPNMALEMSLEPMASYAEEFNPEILFDIFKDDELINEEQIKTLMNNILYYLEDEVKKSDIRRIELSEKDRKNERIININFNSLTLNIVEMVKKLVYFECFTQNKPAFNKKKKKEQNLDLENDLFRLIKALINILSIEKKPDEEDLKKNVKRSSGSPRSPNIAVTNVRAVESQSTIYRNLKKNGI